VAETDKAVIVVYTLDDDRIEFEGATRFRTDEHNNLEILTGTANNPAAVGCFNEGNWLRVLVEDGE
jgi:hypothetical protein